MRDFLIGLALGLLVAFLVGQRAVYALNEAESNCKQALKFQEQIWKEQCINGSKT